MSLRLSSRRIATSGMCNWIYFIRYSPLTRRAATSLVHSSTPPFQVVGIYRRNISFRAKSDKPEPSSKSPNAPLTEEYLRRKTEQRSIIRGGLSASSIFEDEALAGPKPQAETNRERVRNPDSMAAALDPDPVGRRLWERKMVIKTVRKRGRLTRTQLIQRSERELVSRSRDIQGSVKKLVPLAKQIAGKTVDEAIIQMRFSKKKAAKYLKEHLEYARNEAIVKRGMGLGARTESKTTPIHIKTKDGKKVKVTDPTTIYVDQAWTGKGYHTLSPDYRARGRISMMKNRNSSRS